MSETVSQWIIDNVESGMVVVNIGQINKPTAQKLDALVRTGTLRKWRGRWFPIAGGDWGLGSLKTCWGKAQPPAITPAERRAHLCSAALAYITGPGNPARPAPGG